MWRERQRSSSKSSDHTSTSHHSPPIYSNYTGPDATHTFVQESVAMASKASADSLLFKTLPPTFQSTKPQLRSFRFELPTSVSAHSIGASTSADTNISDVSKDDVNRNYKDILKFLGPIQPKKCAMERTSEALTLNEHHHIDGPKHGDYDILVNQIRGLSDSVDRCNNNSNKFVDVFKALTAKISRIEKEHKSQNDQLTNMMKELKSENEVLKKKLKKVEELEEDNADLKLKMKEMEELISVLWQIYSEKF